MARFSLPLAVGFLLLVGLAALLLGGPQSGVDRELLEAFSEPALVPAARLVTRLGDVAIVLAAASVGAAGLLIAGQRRRAILLLAILASERLIVEAMKAGFDRARPDLAGHQTAVHSMAFPSGHSANAMAVWLAIALLASGPKYRRPAVALALPSPWPPASAGSCCKSTGRATSSAAGRSAPPGPSCS